MKSNLKKIKIDNLRSIVMSQGIELLPITILIGRNSAGKSTFARSFPLIRQSAEAKKRAPILWFGDRVDFGTFEESLRRDLQGSGDIKFTFGLDLLNDAEAEKTSRVYQTESSKRTTSYEATIELGVRKSGKRPSQASFLNVSAYGFEVKLRFTESNSVASITCGSHEWRPSYGEASDVSYGSILPKIFFIRTVPERLKDNTPHYTEYTPFDTHIAQKIINSEFGVFSDLIVNALSNIPVVQRGELAERIFRRISFFAKTREEIDFERFSKFISEIEEMTVIGRINSLLEVLDSALSGYYAGVKYIEPLRATAQRYYRKQELAIDEIDSKGENLAMFLDSIAGWRLENFNKWTIENFGFSAKTKNEGGHVEIVIKESGCPDESNLADIGFGFSQILPVITQLWLSTTRHIFNAKETTCIVIEQPELHLHPSFQAKLADVFAAAAVGREMSKQRMIVETHSNHIVNRLGQLISKRKLDSRDVQILIFEKNSNSLTEIRVAGFDERGYLKNWPMGFFEPEM